MSRAAEASSFLLDRLAELRRPRSRKSAPADPASLLLPPGRRR